MNLSNVKINFLGDSITGGGCASAGNGYVEVIARETSATCRNYGYGGSRIAEQQNPEADDSLGTDFCSRALRMDSDADIVVVFGGTNDFGHGNADFGVMTDRTPKTFYGALHTLYLSLIEKYLGKTIVIVTPLHCMEEDSRCGRKHLKAEGSRTLKEYVYAIKEVAEYYSLPVLDLYATSAIQPNVPVLFDYYTADGLHPNDRGHKVIAEKIIKFLELL